MLNLFWGFQPIIKDFNLGHIPSVWGHMKMGAQSVQPFRCFLLDTKKLYEQIPNKNNKKNVKQDGVSFLFQLVFM